MREGGAWELTWSQGEWKRHGEMEKNDQSRKKSNISVECRNNRLKTYYKIMKK